MWKCAREVAPEAGCAATGASGPTPDPGQSPLCAHRTTAWDGSDASPAFLAGSLSSDITGQTVVIVVRRARSLRRGTR